MAPLIPAQNNYPSPIKDKPTPTTPPVSPQVKPVTGEMTIVDDYNVTKPALGKNVTSVPTAQIQKNLGITADNNYGPMTTQAVIDFQAKNGLKTDGIFGPQTERAYLNQFSGGPGIISTGEVHKDAAKNSNILDQYLKFGIANPNGNKEEDKLKDRTTAGTEQDPYLKALDSMASRASESTNRLIANIQANRLRSQTKLTESFDRYKSGLQLLGIQTNRAQSTPDILVGQLKQADNEYMSKLADLDSEENKALMDAENARAENDFKTLKERMDYVRQVRKDQADTLKEYNDKIMQSSKLAEAQIDTRLAKEMFTTIQKITDPAQKEQFIEAVANKFGISPLAVVSSLEQIVRSTQKEDIALAKSMKSESSTTTGITKEQIALGEQKLNATRGEEDGHVDPYVYKEAYDGWIENGGTLKTFLSTYPPANYVNPAATNLPPYLMPKTKTTGRDDF